MGRLFLSFTKRIYASTNSVENTSPGVQLCIDLCESYCVIALSTLNRLPELNTLNVQINYWPGLVLEISSMLHFPYSSCS